MKREYVSPEIIVIEIDQITMLATSGGQSHESAAKPHTGTEWETSDMWGNSYEEGEEDYF